MLTKELFMDYSNCTYINLYNDQCEDLFVNDLSDMEGVFADFERKIKFGSLQHEKLNENSSVYKSCFVNELNRHVDAVAFFEIDAALSLVALVVYTRREANSKEQEFIYSVGYFVREAHRGNGIAGRLVAESIPKLRSFFDLVGPNLTIGPDNSFRYTLESVVAQKNGPSNQIAKKLLHSDGEVLVGKEYRSQEMSNLYKLSI
jgi:hypothetical protein